MRQRTEAAALKALTKAQERHLADVAKAEASKDARDASVLAIREEFGTRYEALAEALGLTKDRVAQLLREQRKTRATT